MYRDRDIGGARALPGKREEVRVPRDRGPLAAASGNPVWERTFAATFYGANGDNAARSFPLRRCVRRGSVGKSRELPLPNASISGFSGRVIESVSFTCKKMTVVYKGTNFVCERSVRFAGG